MEHLLKDYQIFLSKISHDVKGQVNIIKGLIELIHQDSHISSDELKRYLNIISTSCDRLSVISYVAREIRNINEHKFEPEFIELKSLSDFLNSQIKPHVDSQRLKININFLDQTKSLNIDLNLFSILFDKLISNFLIFDEKETSEVEVWSEESEKSLTLFFKDQANKIDVSLDEIFEYFSKLQPWDEKAGAGSGLAIVRKIMKIHNGEAMLLDTSGAGNTFALQFQK